MQDKKKYKQKMRDIWLKDPRLKQWLLKHEDDATRACCKYCQCSVSARVSDLRTHESSKKHQKASACYEEKHKIEFESVPIQPAKQETPIISFVTQPTPIESVNPLSMDELENCTFTSEDSSFLKPKKLHSKRLTKPITIIDKEVDSAQIFGDFVADRLRKLQDNTAENLKDEMTQLILNATRAEKANLSNT